MKFSQIPIHKIKLDDDTYAVSYKRDISLLRDSIKIAGIIDPVILLDEFDQKYKLISGFARVEAAHILLLAELPAVIYSSLETSSKTLFMIRLMHNYPNRSYNPIEKSIIIKKAENLFGFKENEIIEKILPIIGLEKGEFDLKRYRELASYCEELKERLSEETITLETANLLNNLSKEDNESILIFIDQLKPSSSNQKQIIELLTEISLRENCTMKAILDKSEYRNVLKDERMTPSQKCMKLLNMLKKERSPLYSTAEKYFLELKKKLKLPAKVQINHSPNFESPQFEFEIKASNPDEFKSILERLSKIACKKEFADIFHIDEIMKERVEK